MVLGLIAACGTSLSKGAMRIRDAESADVGGCEFVGRVAGSSGWGGTSACGTGQRNAMNEAREQAAELGATHVMWKVVTCDMGGAQADGEAFVCSRE
jgi:hypothetical protein